MSGITTRGRRFLPGLWAGLLLCVAGIAAPSAFAVLPTVEAGRVVARVFAFEAHTSLGFGAVLLWLEQRSAAAAGGSRFNRAMLCVLGALFLTVAGYFGLQPMMAAARSGAAGSYSFAQLHAASLACFGLKTLLVVALAWRAARPQP